MYKARKILSIILVFVFLFLSSNLPFLNEINKKIYAAEENYVALKFDDFEDVSSVVLNKDATVTTLDNKEVLRVNDNTQNSLGSVFSKDKIHLDKECRFSTYYEFQITEPQSSPSYDFMFMLQKESSSPGINTTPALKLNLDAMNKKIEFKAGWYSADSSLPYDIADGSKYYVWIEYDGTKLDMRISDTDIRPATPTFSYRFTLKYILQSGGSYKDDIYAGFIGKTDFTRRQNTNILKWYFKNDSIPFDIVNNTYISASKINLTSDFIESSSFANLTADLVDSDIPVTFETTFGDLSTININSNEEGKAISSISSSISGSSYIRAYADGGISDSLTLNLENLSGDTNLVDEDYDYLTTSLILDANSSLDSITQNLSLPTIGENGSNITWTSSNEAYISEDGVVNRPPEIEGDKNITLSAVISYGIAEAKEKTFDLTVLAISDEEVVSSDYAYLTDDVLLANGYFDYNDSLDNVSLDLNLPTTGENGSSITWTSSNENVISIVNQDGRVTRPEFLEGDIELEITATISYNDASLTKVFLVTVVEETGSDIERLNADIEWLNDEIILNENSDLQNITSDFYLPKEGPYGSTITWKSDNLELADNTGEVTRPSLLIGDTDVYYKASLSNGWEDDYEFFDFTVKADPKKDKRIPLSLKFDNFSTDQNTFISNGESSVGEISSAIYFPNIDSIKGASVFSKDKVYLKDDMSFSTYFEFIFKKPYSYYENTSGFTFTLSQDSNTGYGSDSLGTSGLANTFSVPINMRTYRIEHSYDQGYDYYSYISHSDAFFDDNYVYGNDQGVEYNAENSFCRVWIEYDGNNDVLEIRMGNNENRYSEYTYRQENVDLESFFTDNTIFAGFTSQNDFNISINEWYFKSGIEPIQESVNIYEDVYDISLSEASTENITQKEITAYVTNKEGMPVECASIYFETAFGTLENNVATTNSDGNATITLTSNESISTDIFAYSNGGAYAKTQVDITITDADVVSFDKDWLEPEEFLADNSQIGRIKTNLSLPTTGNNGSNITWESSNTDFIDNQGNVTRPEYPNGNMEVTITANISKNGADDTKQFTLTVLAPEDDEAVEADFNYLTEDIIKKENDSLENVIGDINLPKIGITGSDISWSCSSEEINSDGIVTRPAYFDGDSVVTLTAIIERGSVQLTKTFNITLKALLPTQLELDTEAISNDYDLLDYNIILGANSTEENVIENINLPTTGNFGSDITYNISDEKYISSDGEVTRPSYTTGDKEVSVIATISKGEADVREKEFNLTIKALEPTEHELNIEAVEYDLNWLDESIILGDNLSLNKITDDLNFPGTGFKGSDITWRSSNLSVIENSGKVNRPLYSEGYEHVRITVTIQKGDVTKEKSFDTKIVYLSPQGKEHLIWAKEWMHIGRTLNDNENANNIRTNLNLINLAPDQTNITWESDDTSIISSDGTVKKPYEDTKVSVTAVFEKNGYTDTEVYKYIVKGIQGDYPKVVSSIPENDSYNVDYGTNIQILFDRDIKRGDRFNLISVNAPADTYTISTWKNQLLVIFNGGLEFNKEYRVSVPENAVEDNYGNVFKDYYNLSFEIEEKPKSIIQVKHSMPYNRETKVSKNIEKMYIQYDYSNLLKGTTFDDISLVDQNGNTTYLKGVLNGNRVYLDVSDISLEEGKNYRINVPLGAVKDRFDTESESSVIKFKIKEETISPVINETYPKDGSENVSINQNIYINLSEEVRVKTQNINIRSEDGNLVPINIKTEGSKIFINMPENLRSNTKYTLNISENSVYDLSDNYLDGYEMNFTTGNNTLMMTMEDLKDNQQDVSINRTFNLSFNKEIIRNKEKEITLKDESNNIVKVHSMENDNKSILNYNEKLKDNEEYTLNIPKGTFYTSAGNENDEYKIKFKTAKKINIESLSFDFSPSNEYVQYSPMSFELGSIDEVLYYNYGRKITSLNWDFGDGTESTKEYVYYKSFYDVGQYAVKLTVYDNKGFAYKFIENIDIISYFENIDFNVRSLDEYWSNVKKESERVVTDDYINNVKTYRIDVKGKTRYMEPGIRNARIKVYLIKEKENNRLLGEVETNEDGVAYFDLDYSNLYGTYEILFSYGGEDYGVSERKILKVVEGTTKQNLKLWVYMENYESYWYRSETIDIMLNGKMKTATREWYNDSYCYVVPDVNQGKYEIAYSHEGEGKFYTPTESHVLGYVYEKGKLIKGKSNYSVILNVSKLSGKPEIGYVTSKLISNDSTVNFTDSRRYMKKTIISGIKTNSRADFTIKGNWNGYPEGYIEVKTANSTIKLEEGKNEFSLNLDSLSPGGVYVRMVSKEGTTSPWTDTRLHIVSKPDLGPGSLIRYEDGNYLIDSKFNMDTLMIGKISILDKIPLLDNSKSFGLSGESFSLSGKMNGLCIDLILGGNYESNNEWAVENKKKIKTLGYDVETSLYGAVGYRYYDDINEWKFYKGELTMISGLYKSWTRSYKVPVINIGVDTTLKMGSEIGGTFIVNNDVSGNKDYEGILRFSPSIELIIGAGVDQFKVEGYGGGRVDASLHFPTGYIEIEPALYAGIRAVIFGYTQDVLSESVSKNWNNGKEKVETITGKNTYVENDMVYTVSDLKPLTRDYAKEVSAWNNQGIDNNLNTVASTDRQVAASGNIDNSMVAIVYDDNDNPNIKTMKTNIYPYSDIAYTENNMVWIDDNITRTDANRTTLMYSIYKDNKWQDPNIINDDSTSDFTPTITKTIDKNLVAWQNIKKVMDENSSIDDYVENAEISVCSIDNKGNVKDIKTLTNDNKYDYLPKLASYDDKGYLAWIKADSMNISGNEENQIMLSKWEDGTWSNPETVFSSSKQISDLDVLTAKDEDKALIMFTMNDDIYISQITNNEIGEVARLTNDETINKKPKAVYVNGKWFITYINGEGISYKLGLDGQVKKHKSDINLDYEIVLNSLNNNVSLVYKEKRENAKMVLVAKFYDVKNDMWSESIDLADEDKIYVRESKTIATDEGIEVLYTKTQVSNQLVDERVYKTPKEETDLMILKYENEVDLGFTDDRPLYLNNTTPIEKTTTNIIAEVANKGDMTIDTNVSFYYKDSFGEKLIGMEKTSSPIKGRSTQLVSCEWYVDEIADDYEIYAKIDPENQVIEKDEDNNITSINVSSKDIKVVSRGYENIGADNYIIEAQVINDGAVTSKDLEVVLSYVGSEDVLSSKEIESIEPGETRNLRYTFTADNEYLNQNDRFDVSIEVLDIEKDNTPDNNIVYMELVPNDLEIIKFNPLANERQVRLDTEISLGFNMNIEKGDGFDSIILEDEDFNIVEIIKRIDGKTLLIKPIKELKKGKTYTLTVLHDSVSRDNRNMNDDYILEFTTIDSNPQITSSFISKDEIRIGFNQEIMRSDRFDDIVVYFDDSKKVLTDIEIEKDFISINPEDDFIKGTTYIVEIPMWSVSTKTEKQLEEDYSIELEIADNSIDVTLDMLNESLSQEGIILLDINKDIKDIDVVFDVTDIEYIMKNEGVRIKTLDSEITLSKDILSEIFIDDTEKMNVSIRKIEENTNVSNLLYEFSINKGNEEIVEFENDIQISIYRKSNINSFEGISVWEYSDELSRIKKYTNTINTTKDKILFETNTLGIYGLYENKVEFNDIEDEDDKEKIEMLAKKGIIKGIADNTFDPKSTITRGEISAIVIRSMNADLIKYKGIFKDVESKKWYSNYAQTSYELGIIKGTNMGEFLPNKIITRQELATIVYRMLKSKSSNEDYNTKAIFIDDENEIASYAKEAVLNLYERGIVKAENNKFMPNKEVTRKEAAIIVYNALEYLGEVR